MDDFVCTQCGFTRDEYRSRGLLGCAHCYVSFGEGLQADLAWLHRAPASAAPAADPAASVHPGPEEIARWREQIAEAVRAENYEEAARLSRLLPGNPRRSGLGFA